MKSRFSTGSKQGKQLGALVLALLLTALVLAACGDNTNTPAPAATTAAATTAASTTAAATTAAATTAAATTAAATTAAATTAAATTAAATTAAATTAAATTAASSGTATGKTDYSKVGQELVDAYAGKYKGTKVTIYGPATGEDETKFNNALKPFNDATGINVVYSGDKTFETSINVRVEGGNPPDIADFPQPGLLASIAKTGKVVDLNKVFTTDWLKQNYAQGYIDTATVDGKSGKILGGVFQRVNVKGLVWYPKAAFDQAGYKIPQTWDDLIKLSDQIVKDGDAPWCIGIESGSATGWPATDWVEQLMLRTTSLQNYDKWTTGELPFTAPEVKNAMKYFDQIWLNPKYVFGGTKSIVSTAFGDAPKPMFQNPPKCWLLDQGNFITSYFTQIKPSAKIGVDYDVFQLPAINTQYGAPLEFGGDIMTMFSDRPEVRAVEQWFSTFDGVRGWAAAGGALAPQKDADISVYSNDVDKKVAQILASAKDVRFDGSDLMPGAVGSGTFWKAMTDYVSGSANLDQALQEAQQGWSSVKK
ncbi:MAG TPA: ABC transporter substrate-binding protein [Chloroflexia bacterium]|nr:ABC transporter substrate-binding protein [Chloroflexia bacterium]